MNLVIFDIDGTLTDTNAVDGECYAAAFEREFGRPVDWRNFTHRTDSGIAQQAFNQQVGRAPTGDELERFRHRFLAMLKDQHARQPARFAEVAGAARAFELLRADPQWTVAIATGGWRVSALLKLSVASIEIGDSPAAFADDAFPRSGIVRTAIARSGGRFERIVCVGDSTADASTAAELGLPLVGIGAARREARLRELGVSHVLPNYRDLDALMAALRSAQAPRS